MNDVLYKNEKLTYKQVNENIDLCLDEIEEIFKMNVTDEIKDFKTYRFNSATEKQWEKLIYDIKHKVCNSTKKMFKEHLNNFLECDILIGTKTTTFITSLDKEKK